MKMLSGEELKDGHLYRLVVIGNSTCDKCIVKFNKRNNDLLKTSKSNQNRCKADSIINCVCHSIYEGHVYEEYFDDCEITGRVKVIGEL